MSLSLLVPIVLVVVMTALLLVAGFVIVPAGHTYVVERLGRYFQTLQPGVHALVPFLDRVRFKHALEQTVAVPNEACRTRDDRHAWIDGAVTLRMADPRSASYDVADYRAAIAHVARTTLRQHVATVDLDRLHGERTDLCTAIADGLRPAAAGWGLAVLRYDLTDIRRHNKESAA